MGFSFLGVQIMNQLSDYQRRKLLENPNVESITDDRVYFTGDFKIWSVEHYLKGKHPNDLFSEAGIDLSFFEEKYAYFCLKRWKKKYMTEGKASLRVNSTGLNSPGRPPEEKHDHLSYEELVELVAIQKEIIADLKKKKALAKKK